MRNFRVAVLSVSVVGILLGCVLAGLLAGAAEPAAERYVPDQNLRAPYRPEPDGPRRVIHAQRIVLDGPRCTITLDASGTSPGITVRSKRTGDVGGVFVSSSGKVVVGVSDPRQKQYTAGLWTDSGIGVLQLRETRGTHVFRGREIDQPRLPSSCPTCPTPWGAQK